MVRQDEAVARAMLDVWVQPRATANEIAGWQGEALRVRVVAPPVAGAANDAVCRLLATRLGVPLQAVWVAQGHAGRRKRIAVEGLTTAMVRQRLEERAGRVDR